MPWPLTSGIISLMGTTIRVTRTSTFSFTSHCQPVPQLLLLTLIEKIGGASQLTSTTTQIPMFFMSLPGWTTMEVNPCGLPLAVIAFPVSPQIRGTGTKMTQSTTLQTFIT